MDGGHGDTERGIIPKAFGHIFDAIQVSLDCANSAPSRQQSASHGLHGASWLAAGSAPLIGFARTAWIMTAHALYSSCICHSALTHSMSNAHCCLHVGIREPPVSGAS